MKDIEQGANQKEALQEGKPVELALGDTKLTVGVDLREPQGFKNFQRRHEGVGTIAKDALR